MSTADITLKKGLKVGEVVHTAAVIREATGGDFIEATEEAERLCLTPEGNYILVASPALVGINTLRRQIVKIGDHVGPLTLKEMKLLSGQDIKLLQEAAENLENASMEEVAKRGG
ncbi:MAG: hypothetical protein ABFD75_11180 [Smithella sp.]